MIIGFFAKKDWMSGVNYRKNAKKRVLPIQTNSKTPNHPDGKEVDNGGWAK